MAEKKTTKATAAKKDAGKAKKDKAVPGGKKMRAARELVDRNKFYTVEDAVKILKAAAKSIPRKLFGKGG
jgi:ribosomal protein L1